MTISVLDANVYNVFTARAAVVDHYCNNLPTAPGTVNLQAELVACTNALTQGLASCGGADPAAVASACVPRGTLPAGTACAYHEQCASGWCNVQPKNGVDFQCGRCGRLLSIGDTCDPMVDDVCDGDAYCNWMNHVCTAYAHEGEPCNSAQDMQCELGVLACDDFQTHACVHLGQAGEPCTVLCSNCLPECAWGSVCSNGTCTLPSSGMQPLPTCGMYCGGGGVPDSGFIPCACAEGFTCGCCMESPPCEPVRNVGDPCNNDVNRCGVSTASAGHNPWLACVNGVCREPEFSCK